MGVPVAQDPACKKNNIELHLRGNGPEVDVAPNQEDMLKQLSIRSWANKSGDNNLEFPEAKGSDNCK